MLVVSLIAISGLCLWLTVRVQAQAKCVEDLSAQVAGLSFDLKVLRDEHDAVAQLAGRTHDTTEKLAADQDTMAADWSQLFGNTQAAWDEHIERITSDVTTQFALKKHTRQTVRR